MSPQYIPTDGVPIKVEQAKIEALMLVREKLSNFQDRIRAALGLTDALQPASPAPASTPPPDPSAQPPFD